MWFFTVPSAMLSRPPISLLLQPAASSRSTASSRSDNGSASAGGARFYSRGPRRRPAIRRAATDGSSTDVPCAAARTESQSFSAEQAFNR